MTLTVFDFETLPVRTFIRDGKEWFVGKDVCRCLSIQNHNDALGRLPEDERDGVGFTDPIGRQQEAICINEAGLYRLIFTSIKPEAERFKRFVFHEVLPAIRRTGSYAPEPEWSEMRDKLALVREARLAFGKAAARKTWIEVGLPDVSDDAEKIPSGAPEIYRYIHDFIEECCENLPAAQVRTSELHKVYNMWAAASAAPYVTLTAFGLAMRHSPFRRTKSSTTYFAGLRIREDARWKITTGSD